MELTAASLSRRFCAILVDWLLCLVISRAFADPVEAPWLAPGLLLVVYGLFVGFFAQTLGMRLLRIRCVSMTTGGPIGVPKAILRGALLLLFVPALIMDKDGRGLHDKAAGSWVVNTQPAAS
ncbi:RDD family protein [Dactylosporangium sp. NPDC049742]|uniref:RDD family protein n=1 Tax=Dactylosporangium sp. NPDC049742 TaxID=3154737 RepID=UPI00342980E5